MVEIAMSTGTTGLADMSPHHGFHSLTSSGRPNSSVRGPKVFFSLLRALRKDKHQLYYDYAGQESPAIKFSAPSAHRKSCQLFSMADSIPNLAVPSQLCRSESFDLRVGRVQICESFATFGEQDYYFGAMVISVKPNLLSFMSLESSRLISTPEAFRVS